MEVQTESGLLAVPIQDICSTLLHHKWTTPPRMFFHNVVWAST